MSRHRGSLLLIALLALAAVAGIAASGGTDPRAPRQVETDATAPEAQAGDGALAVVVVRRRGGLPDRWVRRLRRSAAVEDVAETSRTQLLLRRSERSGGRRVDAPRAGYAIPLDTLVVTARAYAAVTPEAERGAVAALGRGRVLLSRTAATLRRLGVGDRLVLAGGRRVRVAGIISDGVARDAEVVARFSDVGPTLRHNHQLTITTRDPAAVDRAVPEDDLTRVAVIDPEAPAVPGLIVRPIVIKQRFGEFAVRLPFGGDWIQIDPAWTRRNIASFRVPVLGSVTCNRRMAGPLRRALGALRRRGLSRLVDPGDYAGCFAPRRIPASGALSLHAWGLAVDINASRNAQNAPPRQDRRLVKAFEEAGFVWGGRWPTSPDGMHFELHEVRSRPR